MAIKVSFVPAKTTTLKNETGDLLTMTSDSFRMWDAEGDQYHLCVNKRGNTLNGLTVNSATNKDQFVYPDANDSVNMVCAKILFMNKFYMRLQQNAPQNILEEYDKYTSGELKMEEMPDEVFLTFVRYALDDK